MLVSPMTVAGWLSGALCALSALFWGLVVLRTRSQVHATPFRISPDESGMPLAAPVVVVIPARDEAAHIERCVEAVLADPDPRLSVVVLDDGSTDGTDQILHALASRMPRLRVVDGGSDDLPEGWLGKPWACERAAREALGSSPDCLLFIDADVRLSRGAVPAAVSYLHSHDLDLLSVMGRLELQSFWEKVIQPAVVGLILAGNDLERVNDPARRPERPLANGQFLLFRADAWRRIGGHEAVRGAIIDDVGLATAVVDRGGAYHLVFGPKLFACRMYSGLAEIWAGWSKNLFEGMAASWGLVAGLVGFVAFNIVLPWMVLPLASVAGGWSLTALAALAVCLQVAARVQLDRRFDQDIRYAVTIPLGWSMLAALAVWSGRQFHGGGGRWKGRDLPAAGGRSSGSGD